MDYWMRRYFYVQDFLRLPLEIYFREKILGVLLKMVWLQRHLVFEFFFSLFSWQIPKGYILLAELGPN
jgi:hypothetical protein